MNGKYEYHPLTPERWSDFVTLFGKKGAYGGCWCMWWRSKRSEFEKRQGEGNRREMKKIVDSGEIPGILAYAGGEPVGWCSIAPRESYPSLNRSPVLKQVDDLPVWSLVCFYIPRKHRNEGISRFLIRAAIRYVRSRGGKWIEAYPTLPKKRPLPPVSSFMGLPAPFKEAGFVEVARPSTARVIVRYNVNKK